MGAALESSFVDIVLVASSAGPLKNGIVALTYAKKAVKKSYSHAGPRQTALTANKHSAKAPRIERKRSQSAVYPYKHQIKKT